MRNGEDNAGALPAFMDYWRLGGGYSLLWNRATPSVHAYLLAGPKGVGKATFARMIAAKAFCGGLPKPCGQCDGCGRVLTQNEPDVIEIISRDDKAIPIERVREMIAQVSQHSFGESSRFVIIEPVEKMTPAAQNCLLKSLEEPQGDTVFYLLTHEPSAVLGTIASRCALVNLAPWSDEALLSALLAMGYDRDRAEAVLVRAAGNIGLAIEALTDESGEGELTALLNQALNAAQDMDVVALSTKLKDDRAGAEKALAALEQALHTALLVRTGILPAAHVGNPAIRSFAENADETVLTALLTAVFDTRKWRQSQVNWQASIDRLLMKIVEAKTRWQQS